mgnify:CR=1 FL=1
MKINKKKIFAWYAIIVSTVTILVNLYLFFTTRFLPLNILISIIGISAGILLLKNKKAGFYLYLAWAFLQIFIINLGETTIINFTQFIYFTLTYMKLIELENYPNVTFLPNIVGIILLILVIFWRKDLKNEK